ncbi:MAG: ferrochelatase [Planctomycetaceae bacterium]|jgi:ferrochelatase|nr:ferrochelatase [Planctomycetaceae bacterium]
MFDGFLLVSYGAPYCESDVVPFLDCLFSGKGVSAESKSRAALKYYEFARRNGGRFSPLNDQCKELLRGISANFSDSGLGVRVYHGNLYWRPFLSDVILRMFSDGVKRAKCFITSAFDSTAGNRRYTYAIESICGKLGNMSPFIERLPLPFNHPLFIEAQVGRLCEAVKRQKNITQNRTETLIFFTAHSIPQSDPFAGNYVEQLNFVCKSVVERFCLDNPDCGVIEWELLYQSRPISGNAKGKEPQWLSPSVGDRFTMLVDQSNGGINVKKDIIIVPIGFFCESMETVNDLDFELGDICKDTSIKFTRALTIGTTPKIYKMITQMTKN